MLYLIYVYHIIMMRMRESDLDWSLVCGWWFCGREGGSRLRSPFVCVRGDGCKNLGIDADVPDNTSIFYLLGKKLILFIKNFKKIMHVRIGLEELSPWAPQKKKVKILIFIILLWTALIWFMSPPHTPPLAPPCIWSDRPEWKTTHLTLFAPFHARQL